MLFKFIIALLSTLVTHTVFAQVANKASVDSSIYATKQRFHAEVGTHGAVATQESHATQVGLDILKNGGNAIDAAVAVGYALAVTLPRAGNLGGGGFMTIWLNKEQKAYVINYRETAPGNINIKEIEQIVNTDKANFLYGFKSAGVPGTVAGLNLAASKFGDVGKTNLAKLINPAIKLAEKGFKLNYANIASINSSKKYLQADKEANRIFFEQNSFIPASPTKNIFSHNLNQNFKQADLGKTLRLIAKNGDTGFYQGKTADLIVDAMNKSGGYISKQDLTKYKAKLVEPIVVNYKKYKIITPPPPASGIVLAEQLNILANIDNKIAKFNNNSASYFHYLSEVMNLSYKDRNFEFGDPDFIKIDINKFLSNEYAKTLADKITDKHFKPTMPVKTYGGKNTTHFVVIDKDLNVVSNTYTLNTEFGTNKIVPGTGFFMNNELDDFAVVLDKPNVYGLIQGEKNAIAPYKQPLSSMTPIIVLDKENVPFLATGSPGGSQITTTVLQVFLNMANYNYDLATSISTPRIHSQLWPDVLYYEDGVSSDSIEKLNSMGHVTEKIKAIGSAQSIHYDKNNQLFYGTADPRRAGATALAY